MASVFEIPQLSEYANCQTLMTVTLITRFSVLSTSLSGIFNVFCFHFQCIHKAVDLMKCFPLHPLLFHMYL